MEVKKPSLLNRVYDRVQQSFFDIMLDLLREKVTEQLTACFLMLVMFLQIVSQLFDPNFFDWKDQYFLELFRKLCDYVRVLNAIEQSGSKTYYWILFYFAISYIFFILMLLTYHYYALIRPQYYVGMVVNALRFVLLIQYWVLFMPFFEVFISIFSCVDNGHGVGYHYLITDMECYTGTHIGCAVLAVLGLIFQLSLNIVIALLYNETQPVKEDCLSRLESTFELLLLFYRIFVCSFAMLCHSSFCGWVLLFVYLASGVTLSYQYFTYIPYYNQFVSIFFGSIINIYTWIAINCLLTKILNVSGHMVILLVGLPFIVQIVVYLRMQRIEFLMDNTMEKINNDVDALIQINMIKDLSIGRTGSKIGGDGLNTVESEMKVKGIINLHFEECKSELCICRHLEELYDCSQQCYLTPTQELHNEPIFIAHYNKKLFEEAIAKFIGSPGLHISFSFYLFQVMKNIHAALHELNIASKKKPSIQQQFTIFRYKYIIENYIKTEEMKNRHIYQQLTKVKDFESLFYEMSRAIESVCNCQVEFWSQLTTAIPDLNVLNDLGNKIYSAAEKAELFWKQLIHINPNYPAALQQYGEYVSLIRNNPQVGKQFIDQSSSTTVAAHVSDQNFVKKSEILFTEDTTVIHISGNRETSGRIVKVSHGMHKCFGYTKQEVIGHNVSFLMPGTIGVRHNEFLEKFYKSGRQRVFNLERPVFALNKQGHCFYVKVLVKQIPSLKEGVQYVGMIRPTYTEFEYIITGLNGNIDSFSKGVTQILNISPQIFKENNSGINIMVLCPELIEIFDERRKLTKIQPIRRNNSDPAVPNQDKEQPAHQEPDSPFLNSKFAQTGGNPLALIVPLNFANIARQEKPAKQGRQGNSKKKGNQSDNAIDLNAIGGPRSNIFSDFMKYLQKGRAYRKYPDIRKLLQSKEYKENEKFKLVQCELEIHESRINRSESGSLKYLVFKIKQPGNKENKEIHEQEGPDNDNDDVMSQGMDDEQDQLNLMRSANPIIQEVFGPKDDALKNKDTQVFGAFRYQFQKYFKGFGMKPSDMSPGTGRSGTQPGGAQAPSLPKTGFFAELLAAKERLAQQKLAGEGVPAPTGLAALVPTPAPQISALFTGVVTDSNQQQPPSFSMPASVKLPGMGGLGGMLGGGMGAMLGGSLLGGFKPSGETPPPILMPGIVGAGKLNHEATIKNKLLPKMTYKSSFITDSEYVNDEESDPKKQLETKSTFYQQNKTNKVESEDDSSQRKLVVGLFAGPMNAPQQVIPILTEIPEAVQQENLLGLPKEDQDTPRIDVKKDIIINDNIKKKTANFQHQSDPQTQTNNVHQLDTIKEQEASIASSKRSISIAPSLENVAQAQSNKLTMIKLEQPDNQEEPPMEQTSPVQMKPSEAVIAETPGRSGKVKEEPSGIDGDGTSIDLDQEDEQSEEDLEEDFEEEIEELIEELDEDDDDEGQEEDQDVGESVGLLKTGSNLGSSRVDPNKRASQHQDANGKWMDNFNNSVGPPPPKKKKLRNYEKIVTHFKDRQHDLESCGSIYFKDWDLGNDEINIREIIKKGENRKLKQERRRRKQMKTSIDVVPATPAEVAIENAEMEEIGRINTGSEEGLDEMLSPLEQTLEALQVAKAPLADAIKDDDDDISEDEHQNSSLIQTDSEQNGDVSSVASSMYSQMRSYFTLRNSIDEKFVPLSIKNLKNVASMVFTALLILNITQFVIQRNLFEEVNQNIQNIHHSEMRISHIIDINLRIQNLRFQNEGLLTSDFFYKVNATEFRMLQNELLLLFSTLLQDSQTQLSLATSSFEEGIRMKINPNDVVLVYEDQPLGGPNDKVGTAHLQFNIWESVIKIVVNVYSLTSEPLLTKTSNMVVRFIQENCLNSLLGALKESTQAILVATDDIQNSSLQFFLYLLIAVSCSLLISVAFLLPIISRAKRSKQEVLELFLHKKIERSIDDQLKLCRWFISKYQVRVDQASNVGAGGEPDGGDENHLQAGAGGDGGMNEQDLKKEKEELYNMKKQKKKKKWRKLNINFGYLSLRLLLIVAILETFYIVNYLISQTFMSEVSSLTDELKLLISREPLYMLVLLTQKELFYSNGTAKILGQDVNKVLDDYHNLLIAEQQTLLELFQSNYGYHTSTYNTQFNSLMYSSICDNLDLLGPYLITVNNETQAPQDYQITREECEAFNLGILKKGLYSTVTKYLSSLKQIDSQFLLLRKSNETARDYINDQKVILSERTCDIYMKKIHEHLVSVLEEDINTFFDAEYKQDVAIFIIFLGYLFFIYFFIWRIFVTNLLDELWKAKSMLNVLPIDMCFKIEEIRLFIYANSSSSKIK